MVRFFSPPHRLSDRMDCWPRILPRYRLLWGKPYFDFILSLPFVQGLRSGLQETQTRGRTYRDRPPCMSNSRQLQNYGYKKWGKSRGKFSKHILVVRDCTSESGGYDLECRGRRHVCWPSWRTVSQKRHISRIRLAQSASSAEVESTLYKQITSILFLVEDTAAQLLGCAQRATKSRPDTPALSAIRTVVNWLVTKTFRSSSFETTLEKTLRKCFSGLHVIIRVTTSIFTIYLWSMRSKSAPTLKGVERGNRELQEKGRRRIRASQKFFRQNAEPLVGLFKRWKKESEGVQYVQYYGWIRYPLVQSQQTWWNWQPLSVSFTNTWGMYSNRIRFCFKSANSDQSTFSYGRELSPIPTDWKITNVWWR